VKNQTVTTLGLALKKFLGEYLPHQRAYSPNTIQSYRDSLKLLLLFIAGNHGHVSGLSVADLSPAKITAFLDHLEAKRGNGAATRNVRLSAIHSFFDYVGMENPEHLDQADRVLNVRFKRVDHRAIDYLQADELRVILDCIDRSTIIGRRDGVLLTFMFNTGARVQEVVALRAADFRLVTPPSVRLFGKGRKERICPLWPETVQLLKQYLRDSGRNANDDSPLFRNHRGNCLTRFGVRLILTRHVANAAKKMSSLKTKRIHPHSLRHSTAVHLLKSGVDLSTIAHWLGHSSVTTTHKYVAIDLEAKRKALAKVKPVTAMAGGSKRWNTSEDLLKWLESL
jgi:site-specific recombinase XerD